MNRRFFTVALLGLALATSSGCSKMSFLPQPRQAKVDPYTAVQNGMSEKQVIQLLGEPTRRSGVNLEGTDTRAHNMTYIKSNNLLIVTLVNGAVIGKQKT